jgi:hypothetical protein
MSDLPIPATELGPEDLVPRAMYEELEAENVVLSSEIEALQDEIAAMKKVDEDCCGSKFGEEM